MIETPHPVHSDTDYRKLKNEYTEMTRERNRFAEALRYENHHTDRLVWAVQCLCVLAAFLASSVVVLATQNPVVSGWFR